MSMFLSSIALWMRRQRLSLSRYERHGRVEHDVAGAGVKDAPGKGRRLPKPSLPASTLDDDRGIRDLP